ncbi:MAG: hypothetical protein AAF489_00925 [Bacteroidota bacterium]
MKLLQKSLELIENQWKSVHYKTEFLADIGIRIMNEFKFHKALPKIIDLNLRSHGAGLPAHGADNIITLAETPSLLMYLHFWVDGIATPHHHCWDGFFMNLKGSVIHSIYQYEEHENLGPNVTFGNLITAKTEILNAGDLVPVYPGKTYIHGLWHIDYYCLSLSVRAKTKKFSPRELTLDYSKSSGIAIDFTVERPDIIQLMKWLGMHYEIDRKTYYQIIDDIIVSEDATTVFLILNNLVRTFNDLDIMDHVSEQDYNIDATLSEHYKNFLKSLVKDEIFTGIRLNVEDFELRGLYGALYLSKGKEDFFKILAQLFPKTSGIKKAEELLYQATLTPILQESRPILKDAFRTYLICILSNHTHSEGIQGIKTEEKLSERETEQLLYTVNSLYESIIFRPLFHPN